MVESGGSGCCLKDTKQEQQKTNTQLAYYSIRKCECTNAHILLPTQTHNNCKTKSLMEPSSSSSTKGDQAQNGRRRLPDWPG